MRFFILFILILGTLMGNSLPKYKTKTLKNGLEVVEQIKCGNGIEVVFQTMSNYLFRAFKLKFPFILIVFLLIFPINIIGLVISKILPRNNDMYLNNIILAKKVKDL